MKNHATQAAITVTLLADIDTINVLKRFGDLSTHLPTDEEKHIDANVLTIPLDLISTHPSRPFKHFKSEHTVPQPQSTYLGKQLP